MKAGHPEPEVDELADSVVVIFRPASGSITPQVARLVTMEVARLLPLCAQPVSRKELQQKLGLRHEDNFRKAYLVPALDTGLIEMTIPEKPNSRFQKYHLTEKGRACSSGLNRPPQSNPDVSRSQWMLSKDSLL